MKNSSTIEPNDITQDSENGLNVASFSHSEGVQYARENNISQCCNAMEWKVNEFIVCCGSVMIVIQPTDFPHIKRRII